MSATTDLQALLRFLSQDAKVPLATALSKVKKLQTSNLNSTAKLAQTKPAELQAVFEDEKLVKQILAAAKRVSKKRAAAAAAGDDSVLLLPSPKKKKLKNDSLFDDDDDNPLTPANLEASLQLPYSTCDASELEQIVLQTNRAPLVLAFVVILLKYTMPEQPLSSRLSLAQAYVSVTSRSRAVYLGIESGKSADEEGFGEGQPVVSVAGKQIKVLRRWGYEWKEEEEGEELEDEQRRKKKVLEKGIGVEDGGAVAEEDSSGVEASQEESPALWALDLEALKKKSGSSSKQPAGTQAGNHSGLPIYTPQSARAYLLKSFATPEVADGPAAKKLSATARLAEKETNLGKLLRALDLLYDSWTPTMSPAELDQKTWSWYAKVRPPVEDGVAGWGEKNQLKLADILALRCMTDT